MADVLSQSEVESLLAALDPGSTSQQSSSSSPRGSMSDLNNAQVSTYDLKRPERVSKDQMRAFQVLHDGFSREFGAVLSVMLRTIIEVKLISVDQLTYSEFVFSLENPTCFNLLYSEGLDGYIILDLNPSIIFPIVDRLLGGGKETRHGIPNRSLTEIELRLVSRITDIAIERLNKAWSNICELKLKVLQVESNPQLVQIIPPNEVIVLVSFEITIGEMRGIMNLCVPFNTIEPLSGKLSSDSWSAYTKRVADPRQQLNLETGLSKAGVEMVVQLAKTNLSAREVANLCIGDVIMLETEQNEALHVFIEGRPLFLGSPGVFKGHKAVQIGDTIIRPKDLVEEKLKHLTPVESESPQTNADNKTPTIA
jgi:flagellar motor switch protein FliM